MGLEAGHIRVLLGRPPSHVLNLTSSLLMRLGGAGGRARVAHTERCVSPDGNLLFISEYQCHARGRLL